jgi:hypothetical protein
MRFVVRLSIVLVVFWFNAATAQEGYLGQDHDNGTAAFTKCQSQAGLAPGRANGGEKLANGTPESPLSRTTGRGLFKPYTGP